MKKKILALTLAAFTFGFVAANAQTQNETQKPCHEQVCKDKKECCKDKKDGFKKRGHKGEAMERQGNRAKLNPMSGIELTEQQKTQIANLREQQKADRKKDKEVAKENKAKMQEAYNAELAKILTPEQYKQYTANVENMKQMKEKKMEKVRQKMEAKRNGESIQKM